MCSMFTPKQATESLYVIEIKKNEEKTHTKKIYFDSDLEPFILELRKYTEKKIIIMNTIHTYLALARERNTRFYLECNGKSHRKKNK